MRAKQLAERYGLKLEPTQWYKAPGAAPAYRVEKHIKMRVHRQCHCCNTLYSYAKECSKCGHQRCRQCPRIPPRRTEAEKEESRKRRAAIVKEQKERAPIVPDWSFWHSDRKVILRRPAKTNAQDLIYRKPRQRIRRNCCQCAKLYHSGVKTCEHCRHVCCTDCPRDPYVAMFPSVILNRPRASILSDLAAGPNRPSSLMDIPETCPAPSPPSSSATCAGPFSRASRRSRPTARSASTQSATPARGSSRARLRWCQTRRCGRRCKPNLRHSRSSNTHHTPYARRSCRQLPCMRIPCGTGLLSSCEAGPRVVFFFMYHCATWIGKSASS